MAWQNVMKPQPMAIRHNHLASITILFIQGCIICKDPIVSWMSNLFQSSLNVGSWTERAQKGSGQCSFVMEIWLRVLSHMWRKRIKYPSLKVPCPSWEPCHVMRG